ncbi:hypothetical protein PNOK_0164500 [Pyrrhoderma noxium]|uniref:Mediator of RNA polymerase II transcription subunit 21 n=1 Tax=Pyrrhoderma noxium TaxID=2282107 RepID=A0A286UQ22_9AGAM|nr:hypothetical protein PNOK_0164500 [Pyrrhoderma noxium]
MLQELSHMDRITQLQNEIEVLLTIMSASISYLCSKTNFKQVSNTIPVTKQRNPEKFDPPEVFEANKKELVDDLMTKAKQIETLIKAMPVPESEETQALRLQKLEEDMQQANEEYAAALNQAKDLHAQISDVLREMLSEPEFPNLQPLDHKLE